MSVSTTDTPVWGQAPQIADAYARGDGPDPLPPPPPLRSRPRTIAEWTLAGLVFVLAASWMVSELGWVVDLAASFAAQTAFVALIVAAALLASGARWPGVVALLGAGLGFMPMGAPRADHVEPAGPERTVRVLQYNANTTNDQGAAAFDMIMNADADIIAITEPPQALLDRIRAEAGGMYHWTMFPDNAGPGWRLTLSRWPIDATGGQTLFSKLGMWVLRIQRPQGHFVFVQSHPDSPRTSLRWIKGNNDLEELATFIDTNVRPSKLPVIVAADLNSSPSGLRGRLMSERFGLDRAKPRFRFGGTYPASWPAPLRLAIDDVFVAPTLSISNWRTTPPAGSDHLGVLVDVVMPPPETPRRPGSN